MGTKPELPAPQPSSHQDAPPTPKETSLMKPVPHAPQLVVFLKDALKMPLVPGKPLTELPAHQTEPSLKDASKTPPESGSPLTELPAHQTDPSLNMPELPDF